MDYTKNGEPFRRQDVNLKFTAKMGKFKGHKLFHCINYGKGKKNPPS